MQRFFVSFALTDRVQITDTHILHQLTRVMRSKIGDSLILFDGDTSESVYQILHIEKKSITLSFLEKVFPKTEPSKEIILCQAIPNKYEKIEYIIQKSVEVGVAGICFFRSDRSQVLHISPQKKERFMTIAREALEQCGGLVFPEIIFSDENLDQISQKYRENSQIVLDTLGKYTSWNDIKATQKITLWVGPEGGWSEEERNKMRDYGFIFAHLGERILRTETAGVVTIFGLLHHGNA